MCRPACSIVSIRLIVSANGRFLRHRPKRSERCQNYDRLYQGNGPLPKSQGVPEGPQRKNHVIRPSIFGERCDSGEELIE